jgi:flagellar assembly protein FliH
MVIDARDESVPAGRWIRPQADTAGSGAGGAAALEAVEPSLLGRIRARVAALVALERRIEGKIRSRWEEAEARIRAERAAVLEECAARRRELDERLAEETVRARETGYAAGYGLGLAEGREQGRLAGLAEGRAAGVEEGRRQAEEALQGELRQAAAALRLAVAALDRERERLAAEARGEVVAIALEVARKLVKREVRCAGDVALRNLEAAVALIFRRGDAVVELHPDDVAAVEAAVAEGSPWAADFHSVKLRAAPEIERGGCRVLTGAGCVDSTLAVQLELIEAALLADATSCVAAAPQRAEVVP